MTDSPNDRLSRIGILSRRNRGKNEIAGFMEKVSQAVGSKMGPDSLLDLELTDAISSKYEQQYQDSRQSPNASFVRTFGSDKECSDKEYGAYKLLECMAMTLSDDEIIYITKLSEICGAVKLKAPIAFLRARDLLALDGDTLMLMDDECNNGLLLDYRKDDPDDMYELTIFGSIWLNIVVQCTQ